MEPMLHEPLSQEAARLYSPLQLAYLGDAVWELLVRSELAWQGLNVRHLHQSSVARVNAAAQARALERMEGALTEEEKQLVLRGRNAHPHHTVPKNQSPGDYAMATGLETLFGGLYITGQTERLKELFRVSLEEEEHA